MGKLLLLGSANSNSGSSSSAFQFTNISGSYTDLLLLGSLRGTSAVQIVSATLTINNITSNSYAAQEVETLGSSMGSSNISNAPSITFNIPGGSATSTSFSNSLIYIPNYTMTNQSRILELETHAIPSSTMSQASRGFASWYMSANTDAITRVDVYVSAGFIAQYSTLYLYAVNWTP